MTQSSHFLSLFISASPVGCYEARQNSQHTDQELTSPGAQQGLVSIQAQQPAVAKAVGAIPNTCQVMRIGKRNRK
jgi:hypothetical protein